MQKKWLSRLACAGVFVAAVASHAEIISEDFSFDPSQNGWAAFGNPGLFTWDAPNQRLSVTWDSTQPNSYFYRTITNGLTRHDDFTFEFDLRLDDIASNTEPGKTGPLELGIGFQNFAVATNANFLRGYGAVSDIAEFCYYPYGYYDLGGGFIYDSPPTFVPSFVSGQPTFSPNTLTPWYVLELPTNVVVHVTFAYTAANQTAVLTATTNGVPLGLVPDLVLDSPTNSNFTATDDFHVDVFAITSYTSIGDGFNSILAHGTVDNLRIELPPPIQNVAGAFSNGVWQVQFTSRTNWLYTLERSTNCVSWGESSAAAAGTGAAVVLEDSSAPTERAFYRVRASRP